MYTVFKKRYGFREPKVIYIDNTPFEEMLSVDYVGVGYLKKPKSFLGWSIYFLVHEFMMIFPVVEHTLRLPALIPKKEDGMIINNSDMWYRVNTNEGVKIPPVRCKYIDGTYYLELLNSSELVYMGQIPSPKSAIGMFINHVLHGVLMRYPILKVFGYAFYNCRYF